MAEAPVRTPEGSPTPAWKKKGPLAWSDLYSRRQGCVVKTRVKGMACTLNGEAPRLFPNSDLRRQPVRSIPTRKESGGLLPGDLTCPKQAYRF